MIDGVLPVTAGTAVAPDRVPRHIAIVMDGNGRWATQRRRPRAFGHRAGVKAVRKTIESCMRAGVEVLTLFAFSSENWSRPAGEVRHLLDLFLRSLRNEARELASNGVRLRFIGERERFSPELRASMAESESAILPSLRLTLNIAVNYGGRWDIVNAARELARAARAGLIDPEQIDQSSLEKYLSLNPLPEPDLFIRTGGDSRISNFLLWHLAYTELYFTPILWPDFDDAALNAALGEFARRERRFGKTSAQVQDAREGVDG